MVGVLEKTIAEITQPLVLEIQGLKEIITSFSQPSEIENKDGYLSKKSAASLIDVSESWIAAKVKEGKLKPHFLDGKNSVRYHKAQLLALLSTEPELKVERRPLPTTRKGRKKRGMNRA